MEVCIFLEGQFHGLVLSHGAHFHSNKNRDNTDCFITMYMYFQAMMNKSQYVANQGLCCKYLLFVCVLYRNRFFYMKNQDFRL